LAALRYTVAIIVINLTRIQPELFVGTCPRTPVDVDRLTSGPRITAVLNLQTDEDFVNQGLDWDAVHNQYQARDLVVARWPIRDFDPHDLRQRLAGAVEQLHALLGVGHRVYVHCTAGIGRAPGVAIAYLTWIQGWDLERAYRFVTEQRACAPYIEAIRQATLDRETTTSTTGA
jgi:protein-tyrosine phosphatase